MTVHLYRSTDTSAPNLTGQCGSLITVLDACLINGYGTQTAAGWTKPYSSGSTIAAYCQGTGSNGYYLKVRDDAQTAGSSNIGSLWGFESMTQVSATATSVDGLTMFPNGNPATGLSCMKSGTADATIRPWLVLADARTFYIFIASQDTAQSYNWNGFGEFYSYLSSTDPGRCMVFGRNSPSASSTFEPDRTTAGGSQVGSPSMFWISRDITGVPIATNAAMSGRSDASTTSSNGSPAFVSVLQFSNPADHRYYVAPLRVSLGATTGGPVNLGAGTTSITYRGRMRGVWMWQQSIAGLSDGDILYGAGALVGRTFLVLKLTPNSGVYLLETSNTWDTN